VIDSGWRLTKAIKVLAIGRPGSAIGAELVAAIREIAVGDLARGAAFTVTTNSCM